jgi:DNA-binding response OmpR family regulator/predicted regulator of Ras-like GTPase activity (Roadblock/LC7/MglB family)
MSDVWRIVVVAGEETFNQNLVNSLRKDGYVVLGVTSGADAVRILWSEEYDVVICDLKTPVTDGFELLQWLRAYRANTRMIMLGEAGSAEVRMQALESGAVSYFEMPLDIRLLKEELRRLLQQTGFSASLDSFDLLDVIQIINMSRKSITLLINTGLEERGILRFQNGDLIWAEYGVLRGDEAFFALAAHKNGTVTEQVWNEQVAANVQQPLSRLIFQALQYRTKYADQQPYSGEMETVRPSLAPTFAEIDDSPFSILTEYEAPAATPAPMASPEWLGKLGEQPSAPPQPRATTSGADKEWWEVTGHLPRVDISAAPAPLEVVENDTSAAATLALDGNELHKLLQSMNAQSTNIESRGNAQTQRSDLPGWLTDQPTTSHRVIPRVAADFQASGIQPISATPLADTTTGAWVPHTPTYEPLVTTEHLSPQPLDRLSTGHVPNAPRLHPSSAEWGSDPYLPAPPEMNNASGIHHTAPVEMSGSAEFYLPPIEGSASSDSLNSIYASQQIPIPESQTSRAPSAPLTRDGETASQSEVQLSSGILQAQEAARRNYATLVSALQTLGYSVPGFVAAAIVTVDGQPIAQVSMDDMDISSHCRALSAMQKSVFQAASDQGDWGLHEHTIITSTKRHLLMRMIGNDGRAFQMLITTRDADPIECMETMANVEDTISAALH